MEASGRGYGAYKDVEPDSHHIIQNAAVRDVQDHSRSQAPAAQLIGPSTTKGSEHYIEIRVQEKAGGGSYAAERRIEYKALRKSGLPTAEAKCHIMRADANFLNWVLIKLLF